MSDASMSRSMSPQLLKVVERAEREPEGRFHSLAHLIDVPALRRAYGRIRKDGAVGVDGVTKEQFGQDLEANLEDDELAGGDIPEERAKVLTRLLDHWDGLTLFLDNAWIPMDNNRKKAVLAGTAPTVEQSRLAGPL